MDLANLPGLWSLTPLGALLLIVVGGIYYFASGRILTLSAHLRELAMERERADEWKETAQSKDAVNNELLKQNGILIANGQRITHDDPVPEQTVSAVKDVV